MIGSGVTSLGDTAFERCANLTNIAVKAANSNYASANGVLFNKTLTTLVQYPGGLTGSYTIPNGVTDIVSSAFWFCPKLTSVTIPNSVTSIRTYQFESCYYLTNVTIGNGVMSIGDYAFYNCSIASVRIPDRVTNLGNYSFYECYNLRSVTIGSGVTNIGYDAFFSCSRLTNVVFPDSVINIGIGAFYGCSGLTSVKFGNSINSISDQSFEYSGLTSVTIPTNITNMGYRSFGLCPDLHQAYFQGNAPSVGGGPGSADNLLFGGESGTVYYLPGTSGWDSTFGGWPTAVWLPQIQRAGNSGQSANGFCFNINWAGNQTVVVEAATNLQNWIPVITNTLVNGTNFFSDSEYTNFSKRFYRVRSQ